MANNDNIQLGPAVVTMSGSLGGVTYDGFDLGSFTSDGVTVTIASDMVRVNTDQIDNAKIFLGNQSATITTPMSEENFDQFYIGIPGAVSGTGQSGGNRTDFGRAKGYDVTSNWSARLVITPTNSNRDKYEFYKCVPIGDVAPALNNNGESVVNVTWEAIHDTTQSDGKRLGFREPQ